MRPGIPGTSDRIHVVSIIGRFLEHSRVWHFANGGAEEYYIGSSDWMQRNFDRRVEAVAPVEDPALHVRLRSLLQTYLDDNRQAGMLHASGRSGASANRTGRGAAPRMSDCSRTPGAAHSISPSSHRSRRVENTRRSGADDFDGDAGELSE